MATNKEYSYFIKGDKIAIVQKDDTLSDGLNYTYDPNDGLGIGTGNGLWKSPIESITGGIEIEYTYKPDYRIPNPITIFKKIYYDDKKENYKEKDISEYDKSFIKLFILNKTKEDVFEKFVNRLHTEIDIHELNIIDEDTSDITSSVREDILDQGEDTLTFLGNYIEQIDTDLDRAKLKDFVNKLYKEASE